MDTKTIYTVTIIVILAMYLVAAFLCFTDDNSGKRKRLAATILFWPFSKNLCSRDLTSREIMGFGFMLLLMLLAIVLTFMEVIS